jgi:hypothetical protein
MTNTLISMVEPGIRDENRLTIHRYLRESYTEMSRHIQQGISFFKEEFRQLQHDAGTCFTNMMLPVNNFLKDPLQMEKEFKKEAGGGAEEKNAPTIVPLEIAMQSPMEENY